MSVPTETPASPVVPPVVKESKVDTAVATDAPTAEQTSKISKEESVPVAETPAPEGSTAPVATNTEVPAKEGTKDAKENTKATEDKPTVAPQVKTEHTETTKETRPKSPSILAKLLAPFKGDRKKEQRSPKKEKKKEEVLKKEEASAVAAATEAVDAAKDVAAASAEAAPVAEATAVEGTPVPVAEPIKESQDAPTGEVAKAAEAKEPAKDDAKPEEKKESTRPRPSATKVGRRLSARVGEFFKTKPKEKETPPIKVDENPPKIDEPAPVAPLENPADGESKTGATSPAANAAKPEESPAAPVVEASEVPQPTKLVEAAPAATPVVAAAA